MNTAVNFRLSGGARVEGDLGHNFLKAFALTLDYPAATLSLAPNKI